MPAQCRRWLALAGLFFVLLLGVPGSTAWGATSGPCDLSSELAPEIVGGGVDGLVAEPGGGSENPRTNYARYGMAGQFWHTHELGCSDVTAVLGNGWANTIFSWAKAVDRVTITTYQASATEGPLAAIKDVVDEIVEGLAAAMYWPYLRPIVILGAIWLAWYGLIRKRATTTAEGVIWMVLAVTVAVWFFSRPGDFTGLGKTVTDATGEVVNGAFAGLPGAQSASCLPMKETDSPNRQGYPQPGGTPVERNADALWSTLVCKPWLMGEFGSAEPNNPYVRQHGAVLLSLQAIDRQEAAERSRQATSAHQRGYEEKVAEKLKGAPIYFLFQGKDWTTRLGIAIGALIAALVAGLLIFLVAVSLLVLKIGFLLLLILAPIFLLIGVHPGSGRIIAMRWFEMLVGTLLRQAVLTIVLAVLVYGYALIMSTAMPWGMQVMFIALLTVAVFFYRRPFQHLFSSIDGHTITTRMLGDAASAPTLRRTAAVLPPVGAYRMARWGLRKAEPGIRTAAAVGVATGAGGAAGAGARGAAAADGTTAAGQANGKPKPGDAVALGRERGAADGEVTGRRRPRSGVAPPRQGAAPPLNLRGSGRGGRSEHPAPISSGGHARGRRPSWFGGGSSADGSVRPSGGADRTAPREERGGGWFSGGGARPERTPPPPRRSEPSRRSEPPRRSDPPPRRSAPPERSGDSGRRPPPLWARPTRDRDRDPRRGTPFWLRPSDRE